MKLLTVMFMASYFLLAVVFPQVNTDEDSQEKSAQQAIGENGVGYTNQEANALDAVSGNNETSNVETMSGSGVIQHGEELPGLKKVKENVSGRPMVDGAAGMPDGRPMVDGSAGMPDGRQTIDGAAGRADGKPMVDGVAGLPDGVQNKGEPLHNRDRENPMHGSQHRPDGFGQYRPNKKHD